MEILQTGARGERPRSAGSGAQIVIVCPQEDHGEQLVFSGLREAELDELREWFCYTKPMGSSVKILATSTSGERAAFPLLATNRTGVRRVEGFEPASAGRFGRGRFKMAFVVNKAVGLPARVIMNGAIDGSGFEKSLEVRANKTEAK